MPRTCGWSSDFPTFRDAVPQVVCAALHHFIPDAARQQRDAWEEAVPLLQAEVHEVLASDQQARRYTAILEYRLPLEARRPDFVVLLRGPVVVVELKGKREPSQGDLDQVAAYARDLRAYHRECEGRPVHAILVPTRADDFAMEIDGVHVVGPAGLDRLLASLTEDNSATFIEPAQFLAPDAYCPLPTLVRAARELFASRSIREIWRARAATDPAVDYLSALAHEAARTRTRHLVLVTGVPGSGKTLVGLRAVHSPTLDDLAIARPRGRPTAAGVFLSGNGPLVQVLQYSLRGAGGGGKTFVRGVKDYLDSYAADDRVTPPEHVLVFDEAQRAFSREMVAEKHPEWPPERAESEPALFVQLCERIPEWSVLVGLVGGGQEIHLGEEEGIEQWRDALLNASDPARWTVHAPAHLETAFSQAALTTRWSPALNLNTELRFHLARHMHDFVAALLDGKSPASCAALAAHLWDPEAGIRLWLTRDTNLAKRYLQDRYADDPDARFGLVASSRDKCLERHFGIHNSYMARRKLRLGEWYADPPESKRSCRRLDTVITEFEAQGLELDMTLLAWGTDLLRERGTWSSTRAQGFRPGRVPLRDPHQLRINAYRVLLTRGRDGTVVFVPPLRELDETYEHLQACGMRRLP